MALIGAILPLPFLILMFIIPETPRWYISKGKTKMSRKSLQWLRGKDTDITDELTIIEKLHQEYLDSERNASQSIISELLKSQHLRPLFISLGLMLFQQMSGINAVIFYTVQIFQVRINRLIFFTLTRESNIQQFLNTSFSIEKHKNELTHEINVKF